MKRRRVVLREAARRDVDEAIAFYLREGAVEAAARFVDDLERTLELISTHAAAGSPEYAHELNLPGLRFWLTDRFPHLVFLVERGEDVDVWRVLRGDRDISTDARALMPRARGGSATGGPSSRPGGTPPAVISSGK